MMKSIFAGIVIAYLGLVQAILPLSSFENAIDSSLTETSANLIDGAYHVSWLRNENTALLLKLHAHRDLFMHDVIRVRQSLIEKKTKQNDEGYATIDPLYTNALAALSIGFSDLPLPNFINEHQAAIMTRLLDDLKFSLGLIKMKLSNTFRGRIIADTLDDMLCMHQKYLRQYKQEVVFIEQGHAHDE